MKMMFSLLCLTISLNVLGQDVDTIKKSNRIGLGHDMSSVNNAKFLYIYNDKKYYSDHIKKHLLHDTTNILYIKVLKGKDALDYGKLGSNGTVIIIMKDYARRQVEKKLGELSNDFKNSTRTNKHNNEITYVLNGNVLQGTSNTILKTLFDLSASSIKSIAVMDKYYKNIFNNKYPVVLITTKSN